MPRLNNEQQAIMSLVNLFIFFICLCIVLLLLYITPFLIIDDFNVNMSISYEIPQFIISKIYSYKDVYKFIIQNVVLVVLAQYLIALILLLIIYNNITKKIDYDLRIKDIILTKNFKNNFLYNLGVAKYHLLGVLFICFILFIDATYVPIEIFIYNLLDNWS